MPDLIAEELVLDIPDPGAAVIFASMDEKGRPAGRTPVKLARLEGLLADLWPESFFTGASGTLTLRGLEVGTHQFLIVGESWPRTFEVSCGTEPQTRWVFTLKLYSP